MAELIMAPSVAVLLRAHLLQGLELYGETGVKVATEVPAARPEKLVRITRTGGAGMVDLIRAEVTVALEVWGSTNAMAERIALKVQGLVNGWEGRQTAGTWVYEARATSPVDFPDPETRNPRYVLQATVVLKASVITS